MADGDSVKSTIVEVLLYVEKVSSFASSINPLFGIVSSLVGVARKGLLKDMGHPMDQHFQAVNTKLESISQKNNMCLKNIQIDAVNEMYAIYEQYIRHQYTAFNDMVAKVKKRPEKTESYIADFVKLYKKELMDESLDVFYRGVMGIKTVFGKPLLKVYLDSCDGDLEIMEHRCSHIAHLFHMGLMALMAFTVATEDDEEEVRETWAERVEKIQREMLVMLLQCKYKKT